MDYGKPAIRALIAPVILLPIQWKFELIRMTDYFSIHLQKKQIYLDPTILLIYLKCYVNYCVSSE